MKSTTGKKITLYGMLLLFLFGCAGCSKTLEERTVSGVVYYYPSRAEMEGSRDDEEAQDPGKDRELFLILSNDSTEETMHLYCYGDASEYQYYYGLSTQFLDKYGNESSVVKFTPGKAVYVGSQNSEGKLSQIQLADEVWEYEGVTRFSVDESRNIFQIADTRYRFGEESFVFSDENQIDLSQLTGNDQLSVVGRDNRILSVVVTTGHGTLQLVNTELFEGSFLQLGRRIFAEITPEMAMELPEGNYRLTVANDGWGGSCDIRIARGETTTMDLDTIKGEGPKYGKILFSVDAPGAQVVVDGEAVDYSEPLDLRYGRHSVQIVAPGYSEWSKYLVVNSPEATVLITLDESGGGSSSQNTNKEDGNTQGDSQSSSDKNQGSSSQSSSDKNQGSSSQSGSNKNQGGSSSQSGSNKNQKEEESMADVLKDYLSTLQNMYIYDKLYQMPSI